MLNRVGLEEPILERRPQECSGGQLQRMVIARALLLEPKFLIRDEPTSALAASIRAQILNLLLEVKEQLDLTLVLISHDLGVGPQPVRPGRRPPHPQLVPLGDPRGTAWTWADSPPPGTWCRGRSCPRAPSVRGSQPRRTDRQGQPLPQGDARRGRRRIQDRRRAGVGGLSCRRDPRVGVTCVAAERSTFRHFSHIWCGQLPKVPGANVETRSKNKEVLMGVGDRAEDLAGKAKEGLGDATDNRDLEAEGKAEESKAEWNPSGDDVADATTWDVDRTIQIDDKR
jgi:uncharacterized protein YjbJ (UPF0337 family)